MKKLMSICLFCIPLFGMAQNTTNEKVAALQAEAAAKAQAAQEAARLAQEAARLAQEAAEAAAEAARLSQEETPPQEAPSTDMSQEKQAQTPGTNNSWAAAPVTVEPQSSHDELKRLEREDAINAIAPYVAADAVPLVNDKVRWVKDIEVSGKDAQQLYMNILQLLTAKTKEGGQLERSKVALINEKEHKIAATFQEWLVFSSSFLSLDRTKINYLLMAECSDGHVRLTMDHITYNYPTQKETINYQAEKWITDKYSVNKKHTHLLPMSGKFRRKTIDLKNQIFNDIEKSLKQ